MYQLPAYSPLTTRALVAGAWACLTRGRTAETRVRSALQETYDPVTIIRTDSGTTALRLAMAAAAAERRAAAIALPAYCCFDVATAADSSDVPVILYDIDPHTLAPDPDSLATALRTEPAAVVVVHLFGVPVDLSAVARLVDDTTTLLVEDAAQGAGASYAGRRLGTMGSVSVLSFGRGKGITGGSGGALLANDERGARFLAGRRAAGPSSRGLRELCTLTAQWALARPGFYSLPASLPFLALGETVYRNPRPPAAPTAASSGVLSVTWALQEFESRVRRQNATRLLQHVDACSRLRSIQPPDRSAPGYLRLPVLAAPAVRDAVSAAGHLGIMPAYPTTLAQLTGFRDRCLNAGDSFPGARALAQGLFTLPTHSRLREHDLQRVEQWIDRL